MYYKGTWLQPRAFAAPLSLNFVVPVSAFSANPLSRPKMQVSLSQRKPVRSLERKTSFVRLNEMQIKWTPLNGTMDDAINWLMWSNLSRLTNLSFRPNAHSLTNLISISFSLFQSDHIKKHWIWFFFQNFK